MKVFLCVRMRVESDREKPSIADACVSKQAEDCMIDAEPEYLKVYEVEHYDLQRMQGISSSAQ